MTREEAIQFLDNMKHEEAGRAIGKDEFYAKLMGYHVEALDMAIKALEQEPYEDVIDRAEAMTEIMMFAGNVKSDEEDIYIKVSDAVQLLRELPPVNPQLKTGHWIDNGICYECSECGIIRAKGKMGKYNYCPSCGSYNGGD